MLTLSADILVVVAFEEEQSGVSVLNVKHNLVLLEIVGYEAFNIL